MGASIEDSTGDPERPIYDFHHAVERVAAAVETARAVDPPMLLTARPENLLFDPRKLDDTIRRLQAFEAVGADVLYAPYIRDLATMKLVVDSVSRPVNVVMGFADPEITLADLRDIGVRRISIGGALSRLAMAAFMDGARSMRNGDFGFVRRLAPIDELMAALG